MNAEMETKAVRGAMQDFFNFAHEVSQLAEVAAGQTPEEFARMMVDEDHPLLRNLIIAAWDGRDANLGWRRPKYVGDCLTLVETLDARQDTDGER